MNRLLLVVGALAASALLVPTEADAQRMGGRGFGGGARIGGGFGGGGVGGPRMWIPSGRLGGGLGSGPRVGIGGGFPGGGIATRPGGFYRSAGFGGYRATAVARPGWGGVYRPGGIYRPGFGGYGWRAPYYGRVAGAYRPYYGGRYRYYGGYYRHYPYYGGALITGLTLGALSYPYDYGYGYDYPYYGVTYGGDCYWVRRRVVGPYGQIVSRRVQVCEY